MSNTNFGKYGETCRCLGAALLNALGEKEEAQLRAWCREHRVGGVVEWVIVYREHIFDLLRNENRSVGVHPSSPPIYLLIFLTSYTLHLTGALFDLMKLVDDLARNGAESVKIAEHAVRFLLNGNYLGYWPLGDPNPFLS